MMHLNEKNRAIRNAKQLLVNSNVDILELGTNSARPVFHIAPPGPNQFKNAIVMREARFGQMSTVYIARFAGCLVRWSEQEQNQQYKETA